MERASPIRSPQRQQTAISARFRTPVGAPREHCLISDSISGRQEIGVEPRAVSSVQSHSFPDGRRGVTDAVAEAVASFSIAPFRGSAPGEA